MIQNFRLPYTLINQAVALDENLSLAAKGLLLYLSSFDGFVDAKQISKDVDSKRAWKELCEKKFIIKDNQNWIVYGTPNNQPIKSKIKKFQKPTLEEVADYFIERTGSDKDHEKFYDFYESKGWKVGKNPMKDWKAAVRNWTSDIKKPQPYKTSGITS